MLSIKTETGWKEAHTLRVRVDDTWNPTQDVWVKKDGTWHSTCRYIMSWTGFVKRLTPGVVAIGGWGGHTIMQKRDGSPFSFPGGLRSGFMYNVVTLRAFAFILPFSHRGYLGQTVSFLNSLRDFRWTGGPWLPLAGVSHDRISEEYYTYVRLYASSSSAAALDAHLAQNINKTVTIYFR